jgi:iron complex transport system substrate-binding protein
MMPRPRPLFIVIIIASIIAVDACRGRPQTSGDSDRHAPQRIVSLIPSTTETIVALGAIDRLVARSKFDVDPALAHLPSVGEGLTPSLEQLTALQPDLVIAWPDNPSRSVIARLEEFGTIVYSPQVQTLADVRSTSRELGALLGLEDAADSLVAAIDAGLDAVRESVAGLERPGVFYVVWYDPPMTTGPGTYVDELIEIAGGSNVFADARGLWPQVSMEEIVRREPDIILLSYTDETPVEIARLGGQVGWRELSAMRRGDVFKVDANLFNRPGPRVTEAARRLARLLHPEAFSGGTP